MKTLAKLLLAALLVLAFALPATARLGTMRISLIENEVQIMTPEAGNWGYAAANTPLDVGDRLWVPRGGRAELQLSTGTCIRLDGDTALQVLSLDEDNAQFYLSQGRTYIYFDAPRQGVLQIDTPDASTRVFSRAIFNLSAGERGTEVAVYKGSVTTENRAGSLRVNAGDMVSLGPDSPGQFFALGYPDDWIRWNQSWDERLVAARDSASDRYLPVELRPYASDLDMHGRWVEVREYGHVWTPRTHIRPGWSPYREGRWIWRHGDYIWVPYEPWGWAPCHYGRWAFVHGLGWVWVPPRPGHVYWGPGYVGWIRTVEYVGWVPLAPGEVYYGRGYYGPDSFNVADVPRERIHFSNRYRNMEVGDAPVIVEHDTFFEVPRPVVVDKNVRDRIFTPKNMIPGAPDIKPGSKGFHVIDRDIGEEKLPPRPIRIGDAMEEGRRRPLVREPNDSVFRTPEPRGLPGFPPAGGKEEGRTGPPRGVPLPAPRDKSGSGEQWDAGGGGRPLPPDQPGMKPRAIGPGGAPGTPGGVEPLPAPREITPSVPEEGGDVGRRKPPAPAEQPGGKPRAYVPDEVPGNQGGKVMILPAEQERPGPPPDQGRKKKEQVPPPQAIQPVQPPQPQPVQPKGIQPSPQPQPVQPKAIQPPPQPKPVQPKAIQPPPQPKPVQPKATPQPPPAVPEESRKAKGKGKEGPAEAPQCGPGQKDQFDPAQCPQNFPNKMR